MADIEVKELTSDELSAILHGGADKIVPPPKGNTEPIKQDDPVELVDKKDDIKVEKKEDVDPDFKWDELDKMLDTKDPDKKDTDTNKTPDDNTDNKPKGGRKVTDLVAVVNEMIQEELLFGFEDGEPKTIEEAKELIKLNLEQKDKQSEDKFWETKLSKYSPQIQAIIEYAERGGTDVSPLISAISEIERTGEFDVEKENDQEEIIKEYLKVSGWDEADIKEEIETSKDLGKLKQKAEKFLPKLNQMKEQRIQMIMEEQEQAKAQAEQTRKQYLKHLKDNLDKPKVGEIKLDRSDKANLWDALTNIKYTSWNGQPTNGFFKKLEELQTARDGNYEQFLEAVHLVMNRESFIEKIRSEIQTKQAAETARRLKTEQTRKASSESSVDDDEAPISKSTIRRTFKNPWG